MLRGRTRGQTTSDRTHRSQQWQLSDVILDGLIGNSSGTRSQQRPGQLAVRCQVQISK